MTSRVILLTGASSGIGAAAARALAKDGHTLVLAARRSGPIEALAAEITRAGGAALAVQTDATDPAQIERLAERAIESYGHVDVLINNAGIGQQAMADAAADADIAAIMATNFVAPVQLTRALMPSMRARGSGHVINIGSVASFVAAPTSSVYAASKFALRAWNDVLRRELRGSGVSVSLVAPGFIRTPMTEGIKAPMPGPEAVAAVISGLIHWPRRVVFVPWVYGVMVWLAGINPAITDVVLSRVRRPN